MNPIEPSGIERTSRPQPAKILVVDQDRSSRETLRQVLAEAHPEYEISFAETLEQTLSMVQDLQPDLIFLDVLMPDADGFELCLMLKADERYKNIPLFILTSLDRIEHKIKAFRMGASDYILKPINGLETNARVEAHLRIKRFQDRQRELNAELRETQAALLQSSKMSAAGTLAAGVAHEFNNILQIIGAATEICGHGGSPSDVSDMVRIIRETSERGMKISKGLLDFSRRDEYQKKEPVYLQEVLRQDLRLLHKHLQDRGVELAERLDELPPVEGYSGQLSQIFINLVNNAVDSMAVSPKRKLDISLERCRCARGGCEAAGPKSARPAQGCAILRCADTGAGIPAEIREKIFEPFVTTKGVLGGGNDSTPGTGLGLSICYGIVRRHQGTIRFDDHPGGGTVFTVTLPLLSA